MHVLADGTMVGDSVWRKILDYAKVRELEPRRCNRCHAWGHTEEAHIKDKYKIERN